MIFDMTKRKGGGGYTVDGIAQNLEPSGDIVLDGAYGIGSYAFYNKTKIETVRGEDITSIGPYAFAGCTGIKRVYFPKATVSNQSFNGCTSLTGIYADSFPNASAVGQQTFRNLSSAQFAVLPKLAEVRPWQCLANNAFAVFDIGQTATSKTMLGSDALHGCNNLATIILRYPEVATLGGVGCFNDTPFKSGGTGGTIYIPKSLYDHLGDGTANDYKAATNWSNLDGYGTVTWAKIEGSIYETHYADGTPIQTT